VQEWEYCQVNLHTEGAYVKYFEAAGVRSVNVRKDKAKGDASDKQAGERLIAELGVEGWELVAIDAANHWIFKRPKE
jgi:hypothetical protein